ncbi:MAG: hypothetical protein IIZ15_03735, partial [Coriobacteriales bacterium]|nr:hypothetical protein [Coriobacteriales bacterium]
MPRCLFGLRLAWGGAFCICLCSFILKGFRLAAWPIVLHERPGVFRGCLLILLGILVEIKDGLAVDEGYRPRGITDGACYRADRNRSAICMLLQAGVVLGVGAVALVSSLLREAIFLGGLINGCSLRFGNLWGIRSVRKLPDTCLVLGGCCLFNRVQTVR